MTALNPMVAAEQIIRPVRPALGRGRILLAGLLLAGSSATSIWLFRVGWIDSIQIKGLVEWLSKRWGWTFGTPVLLILAIMAGVGFLAVLGAAFAGRSRARQAWAVLIAVSAALGAIGLWYAVGLMIVGGELNRGTWCLLPLGLGMLGSLTVLASLPTPGSLAHMGRAGGPNGVTISRGWAGKSVAVGLAMSAVVVAGQWFGQVPPDAQELGLLYQLLDKQMAGEGANRLLVPSAGRAVLRLDQVPMIGSPQAPHVLYTFFDYRDPLSWHNHKALHEARRRYGDQLAIVTLVYPMDSACNPRVPADVAAKHPQAMEFARLALAVWRADRTKFEAFHDFLMTPRSSGQTFLTRQETAPVTLDEARSRAVELIGREALEGALSDPWVDKQISIHIQAKTLQVTQDPTDDFVPATFWLIPGKDDKYTNRGVVGAHRTSEDLFKALEFDLGIKPERLEVDQNDPIMKSLSF